MTSRAPSKLVVHHRSSGVAMGTLEGFFVMRCYGETTPEDIYATLKCHEAIIAVRPLGSISIVAVDPTATFPSEATRRAAVEVTRKTRPQTLGHVVIVLGDGFWASAIRGVLMTLTALSPTDTAHPRKVVRREEEGVDWVIEVLGESPQKYRSALLTALSQLRPAVMSSPPSNSPPPGSKAPAPTSRTPGTVSKAPPASKVPPSSKRRSG